MLVAALSDGISTLTQPANGRKRLLADRGYDNQANRLVLQARGLQDDIARRAKPGQTAETRLNRRNQPINKIRARVKHDFAALRQQGGDASEP
ncbi:hypothetical protein GCM10009107_00590 [Ideonella azotifigens]|uniref:Transposase IS4-like domain-containing protein n=1 Tax=Ideonella azotifigens TaxID=513160 RepID=A0ABN1JH07_9BURK